MKKVKTAYQIKALLKAQRTTRLMRSGYSFRATEGTIVEVNAYGAKMSPVELALLEGASQEEITTLLEEREKLYLEWVAQKEKEKETKENTETVD